MSTASSTQPSNDRCICCAGAVQVTRSDLFDTRFGLDELYELGVCNDCGVELTCPVGGPANLEQLYEDHYNFGGERDTRYTRLRDRALASPVYDAWLKLDGDVSFYTRRGTGRLLDVGCNEGRALEQFRRNGWRVEGLELNRAAAAIARARGVEVHTQPLAELDGERSYDVIVLSNVLEHVRDPNELLASVKRLLVPGGEVWISCPNNQSWMRRLFGKYWINWHVPFHLVHFSTATLERLLGANGFDIVRSDQATPGLWVAQSVIARVFARRGTPTRNLRNPLMVAGMVPALRFGLFPILALANRTGHGDCLVTIARRPAS